MRKLLFCFLCMFVAVPAVLFAQDSDVERPKFGVTFPSTGVIWNITEHVAFLPAFDFTHSHNWSEYSALSDSKHNLVNFDAELRFYVREWNKVQFYLAPRYSYGWANTENHYTGDFVNPDSDIDKYNTHQHAVSGSWGLQYAVSDQVSIFGDIGLAYRRNLSPGQHSNSIGTTGTWGLILYVK